MNSYNRSLLINHILYLCLFLILSTPLFASSSTPATPIQLLGAHDPNSPCSTGKRKALSQPPTETRAQRARGLLQPQLSPLASSITEFFQSAAFAKDEKEMLNQLEHTLATLTPSVQKKCHLQASFAVLKKTPPPHSISMIFHTNDQQLYHSSATDKAPTKNNMVLRKGQGKKGVRGARGEKKPAPRQHHHAERAFLSQASDADFWDTIPDETQKLLRTNEDSILIIYLANKFSSCSQCASCLGVGDSQSRICNAIQTQVHRWRQKYLSCDNAPSVVIIHRGIQHFHNKTRNLTTTTTRETRVSSDLLSKKESKAKRLFQST